MGRPLLTHPAWCAGGHRCGLGEHRSEPHVVVVPGVGRAVITRVAGRRQHAEVLVRLELADVEGRARWQLVTLLRGIGVVLHRARARRALARLVQ